ncbi:hypothetical protein GCM10009647_067810 [Streptomyces sanglieri]
MARPPAEAGRTAGGATWASRVRSGAAARRASRMETGSGDQPAVRPSSTMGGAMDDVRKISAGGPETTRGAQPIVGMVKLAPP